MWRSGSAVRPLDCRLRGPGFESTYCRFETKTRRFFLPGGSKISHGGGVKCVTCHGLNISLSNTARQCPAWYMNYRKKETLDSKSPHKAPSTVIDLVCEVLVNSFTVTSPEVQAAKRVLMVAGVASVSVDFFMFSP